MRVTSPMNGIAMCYKVDQLGRGGLQITLTQEHKAQTTTLLAARHVLCQHYSVVFLHDRAIDARMDEIYP